MAFKLKKAFKKLEKGITRPIGKAVKKIEKQVIRPIGQNPIFQKIAKPLAIVAGGAVIGGFVYAAAKKIQQTQQKKKEAKSIFRDMNERISDETERYQTVVENPPIKNPIPPEPEPIAVITPSWVSELTPEQIQVRTDQARNNLFSRMRKPRSQPKPPPTRKDVIATINQAGLPSIAPQSTRKSIFSDKSASLKADLTPMVVASTPRPAKGFLESLFEAIASLFSGLFGGQGKTV